MSHRTDILTTLFGGVKGVGGCVAMQGRTIHVYLLKHKDSGLFVAVSAELSGLVVHGHSPEEIEGRLADVIHDLLEAEGHKVNSVTVQRDERLAKAGFAFPPYIASAALAAINQ